jgi:hypothetical protein
MGMSTSSRSDKVAWLLFTPPCPRATLKWGTKVDYKSRSRYRHPLAASRRSHDQVVAEVELQIMCCSWSSDHGSFSTSKLLRFR